MACESGDYLMGLGKNRLASRKCSSTLERITGALLGTFAGDALGMSVEGWSERKLPVVTAK